MNKDGKTMAALRNVFSMELSSGFLVALLVSLLGGAVRWWFVFYEHEPWKWLVVDMAEYDRLGGLLATGSFAPKDLYYPIGYPLIIGVVYRLGGTLQTVGFFHVAAGGVTAGLASWIVAKRTNETYAAAIVGLLTALYPPSVFYAGCILTETLFGFFLMLGLALFLSKKHRVSTRLVAGVVFGIAGVIRPNLVFFWPVLLLLVLINRYPSYRTLLRFAAPVVLGMSLVFAPVCAYTSSVNGRLTGPGAHGATNMFVNQQEDYSGICSSREPYCMAHPRSDLNDKPMWYTDVPFREEAFYYRKTWEHLRTRPMQVVYSLKNVSHGSGLVRDEYLWPAWMLPYGGFLFQCARYLSVALFLLLGIALWGRLRKRRPWSFLRLALLAMVINPIVTWYLFQAELRMIVPFAPVILCLGAELVRRRVATADGKLA